MQPNSKSLLSLKKPILIFVIVFWNAGFLFAIFSNGGFPDGLFTKESGQIIGTICMLICAFFLSVAISPKIQDCVISKERKINFSSKDFYFLSFLLFIIGLSRFIIPMDTAF